MSTEQDSNFKVLATKVSIATYRRIHKIARKQRTTIYEMVQNMCDCIVRYMDDRHNLTPEMEQAMSIFEHLQGWKDNFNWADPTTDPIINSAIYFVGDPRKKGVRGVKVERPFMGDWKQDENIQHIVEYFFNQIMPERYRRLRLVAVSMGCTSMLQLLDKLIDLHADEEDIRNIRQDFEDANRSEFGVKPHEGQPFKRVFHKGVDMYEKEGQTTIRFDEEDKATAIEEVKASASKSEQERQWLEDNMDFKPHGYDW